MIEYMATKSMQVKTVLVSGFTGHVCRVFDVHVQKAHQLKPLSPGDVCKNQPSPIKKRGGRFGTSGNH